MLSGNIYNNSNPINYMNIIQKPQQQQQLPIAYHHLHKYYNKNNFIFLTPSPQALMPSLDNNNNFKLFNNKVKQSNGVGTQYNSPQILNNHGTAFKNSNKVKDLIAKHNNAAHTIPLKEEKVIEIDRKNAKFLSPRTTADRVSLLPIAQVSKEKQQWSSTPIKTKKDAEPVIATSSPTTASNIPISKIGVYNKKPRFKTMHVEPNIVREAAAKNIEKEKNIEKTASLVKTTIKKNTSTNDSDYSTLEDESKKTNLSDKNESKNYYNNSNNNKNNSNNNNNKGSNKVYDSSNSFKSSINSFISNFSLSNEKHQQKQKDLSLENNALSSVDEKKLLEQQQQQKDESIAEKEEAEKQQQNIQVKNLTVNQAILSTSDYSSFNSQLSNNCSKLATNTHEIEKSNVTPKSKIEETVKKELKQEIPKINFGNNKNFNENDYKKYIDNFNLNGNKDHAARGRNKISNGIQPMTFKSPIRMIRLNNLIKTRQSSNPPSITRGNDQLELINNNNREIIFHQNPKTEKEDLKSTNGEYNRKVSFIPNGNNATVAVKSSNNKEQETKIQDNVIRLLPKDPKNMINKAKVVKLQDKALKVHQLPPPPPTMTAGTNKTKDTTEKIEINNAIKHASLSPQKCEELLVEIQHDLKPKMSQTHDNLLQKDIKLLLDDKKQTTKSDPIEITKQVIEAVPIKKAETNNQQENSQFGELMLPLSLIKNIEKNIEKNINEKSQQKEEAKVIQQKIGTLYAPRRKHRHSVLGQEYIKPIGSAETTFSTTEENNHNTNEYMNKVNLPNIDGIDYYYRNKNDNK